MSAPYAGYQQSLPYSAAKDRAIIDIGMHAIGGVPMSGVVLGPTANFNFDFVSWDNPTRTVTISAGVAMVGSYKVVSPANKALVLAAGGGYVRRDLVIVRVYDTEGGDATSHTEVEVVQGTQGSSSDPTVPARSLILFHVDVTAGGTFNVVDRRKFTAAAGGVRQALVIGDAPYAEVLPGAEVWEVATNRLWRREGNALMRVPKAVGPNTGPDMFSCWNVGNFDSNGLWYASWSGMGVSWTMTPAVSAMVAVYNTGGGTVPVHLQVYKPHNNASTLVLMAHYVQAGDVFRGSIDLCLIAMGQFA